MEALSVAPERLTRQQWLLGAAVAALFAGLQGVWQFVSLLVFFVQPETGFSERVNFFWDIFVSAWGVYLAYAVIAVVAAALVRQMCEAVALQDLWSVIWRAAVTFAPISVVITFCIAFASALVHDRPMSFLGFVLLG